MPGIMLSKKTAILSWHEHVNRIMIKDVEYVD